MKTHLLTTLASASLSLCAFCAVPTVYAQSPQLPPLQLELVTPQSESLALGKIMGKPLRGSNNEELGSVADFLVNPKSGQLEFAVVPTGRGASGETFRLVPLAAIDPSRGYDHLVARLGRDQWDRVGTMTEKELQGAITLNAEQMQREAQQFGLPAANDGHAAEGLVRASSLKGSEIRGGNELFGNVDDVAIDMYNRRAAPMLTFAGGQKFLVPFDRLQLTAGQKTISTNLSRWDFQRMQRGQGGLTPTGSSSAAYGQGQGRQPAFAAASAVQQALSRDQAASGVQVIPESRLVLRGTVESDQKKAEVERAASQAAPGMRIDSELTVRRW
jgi:hypothetical protein